MALSLIYDQAHMNDISKIYTDSADKLEIAQKSIDKAAQKLQTYYEGRGNSMFCETMKVVYEHLKLLEICTRGLNHYVEHTYTVMSLADKLAIGGGK